MFVAHADWGARPVKQWVGVAVGDVGQGWAVRLLERVGDVGGLRNRMHVAGEGTALLGFDFPIGLPRAYAAAAAIPSFPDYLWAHEECDLFASVADTADEISHHRPFYPDSYLPKGSRKREHLAEQLGIPFESLRRRCDQRSATRAAAAPVFWTCGGGQVGKAALSGWSLLRRESRAAVTLWPFDGDLEDLLQSSETVVAETYPAEFYLHLGVAPVRGKAASGRSAQMCRPAARHGAGPPGIVAPAARGPRALRFRYSGLR